MTISYSAFAKYGWMQLIAAVIILVVIIFGCNPNNNKQNTALSEKSVDATVSIATQNGTIEHRLKPLDGYSRTRIDSNSFAYYLRTLPLKDETSKVLYFNGDYKTSNGVYVGVIDLPIGKKDLHQCADAIMRLRAEYLWRSGKYNDIHFNFTNGHKVEYSKWMEGNRMLVNGNKTQWKKTTNPSNTYTNFWEYLELIFLYAGTASLEKELLTVDISDMQIGDVFIQGGYPGHAVVVVDMIQHNQTGKKAYILAQSYMPAQELQVLSNPTDDTISPWYTLEKGQVQTPEWDFTSDDLMRFVQ